MGNVNTKDLFDCNISYLKDTFNNSKYPWEILPKIKDIISNVLSTGLNGYVLIKEGVLVGENVNIYPTATIIPPAIIGSNTEIRPGAFLRGNVIIGEGCVIGNSSELKNSILLDHAKVPHYNYVGDSILGNYSHMGAGSICSNLRLDEKNIVIKDGDDIYNINLKKIGAILGDYTQIGCGAILNPGTILGKSSFVYPQACIKGVYPSKSIIKK